MLLGRQDITSLYSQWPKNMNNVVFDGGGMTRKQSGGLTIFHVAFNSTHFNIGILSLFMLQYQYITYVQLERQHQGMNRPVIVLIAAHRKGQKSMGDNCSRGVCRSTQMMLGYYRY